MDGHITHRNGNNLRVTLCRTAVIGNDKSNVVVAADPNPGLQLNTLVDGLKLAPVGTLLALKARPSPSGSLAVAVKVRKSTFIYAPGTDRTEHRRPVHIAHREMVTVSESLSAGLPSSVTVKVHAVVTGISKGGSPTEYALWMD